MKAITFKLGNRSIEIESTEQCNGLKMWRFISSVSVKEAEEICDNLNTNPIVHARVGSVEGTRPESVCRTLDIWKCTQDEWCPRCN